MYPPGERYLTRSGLERALAAGRNVEQWLGVRREGDGCILKWLSIEHRKDGSVVVRAREVWDEGGPDFLDVYEFTSCDPDNDVGVEHIFEEVEEALRFATSTLGAAIVPAAPHSDAGRLPGRPQAGHRGQQRAPGPPRAGQRHCSGMTA